MKPLLLLFLRSLGTGGGQANLCAGSKGKAQCPVPRPIPEVWPPVREPEPSTYPWPKVPPTLELWSPRGALRLRGPAYLTPRESGWWPRGLELVTSKIPQIFHQACLLGGQTVGGSVPLGELLEPLCALCSIPPVSG